MDSNSASTSFVGEKIFFLFLVYIISEIRKAGFEKPTAIQSQGWPMALSGRDVVGIVSHKFLKRIVCFKI